MVAKRFSEVRRTPPLVIAVDRQRVLLAMKGHSQNFGIFRRGIEVIQMHRQQLWRQILIRVGRSQTTPIGRFGRRSRRWNRFGLFPAPQTPELLIERHHVGQRGGTRARKTDDVNGPKHRCVERFRMGRQPGFKMQPVLETPAKRRHHRVINRRIKLCIVLDAHQQLLETLDEVARSKIVEVGHFDGLRHQFRSRWVATTLRS